MDADKLTAEQVAVKVLPKEPLPPAGGGPVGARSRYASRERVLAKLRRETEFLRRLQVQHSHEIASLRRLQLRRSCVASLLI